MMGIFFTTTCESPLLEFLSLTTLGFPQKNL